MDGEKTNGLGAFLAIAIIFSIIYYSISQDKDLSENKAYTTAKVIDYFYVGGKTYIKYVFFVNGKRIEREKKVYPFKCDNGVKGCVGSKFKVAYSKKNPNNNEIDLGKYKKYTPNKIKFYN